MQAGLQLTFRFQTAAFTRAQAIHFVRTLESQPSQQHMTNLYKVDTE